MTQDETSLSNSIEPTCKVCLISKLLCICPECSQCGERGKVDCYRAHPMKLNQEQLVLRTEAKVTKLSMELDLERNYLQWLEDQSCRYCEDWSEI